MNTIGKVIIGIIILILVMGLIIATTFMILSLFGISLIKNASGEGMGMCDTINIRNGMPVRNYRKGIFNSRWIVGPYMCAGYWKPRLGSWNYPASYYNI